MGKLTYNMRKYWPLYVMALPGTLYFILFKYIPLGGSVIAFQDYSVFKGINGSPWVGFKHFTSLFEYPDFYRVLRNTLVMGFLRVTFMFAVPLILALMINEIRHSLMKKGVQTALYIPHFLSWVIIAGIAFEMTSLSGLVNTVRGWFGLESMLYMQMESYFRPIFVLTGLWKDAGWGTIIYLAALSGINPQLYEAAVVDGASRLKQILYITFPMILPTAAILFLLDIGNFMELGFEQVYNLLTPMTYSVGDIFDTYVFRTGIQQAQYSFATAVGLFQAVVGMVLVIVFNKLSKKYSNGGLW
ncbi:protein lplB [Salipaludibacillus neizhouensis]|uniref:Protein lplB n=1 Tax=Salipaludibacillus neizhouensis TaxID=885475 RepID=A0A3A9K330_9BACI|nr:ABC transporter permease subunit [Salipaludibacillus neizhouensis]RKL64882.1 protein lplB [Salipaludibacillus neizhouensis]